MQLMFCFVFHLRVTEKIWGNLQLTCIKKNLIGNLYFKNITKDFVIYKICLNYFHLLNKILNKTHQHTFRQPVKRCNISRNEVYLNTPPISDTLILKSEILFSCSVYTKARAEKGKSSKRGSRSSSIFFKAALQYGQPNQCNPSVRPKLLHLALCW